MGVNIELVVLSDHLPDILEQMPGLVQQVLEATSTAIVSGCQARSRVDTGEMQAGWMAEPVDESHWHVTNPVEHTIYNELGTIHMSAQPMLTPSVEENQQPFIDAWRQIEGLVK